MFIKKKLLTMVVAMLSLPLLAIADTEAETELQIKEKTSRMVSHSDEGLEIKVMDDGTEYIDLEGRFQMYTKVKIVDGKQVIVCDGNHNIENGVHIHHTNDVVKQPKRAVK